MAILLVSRYGNRRWLCAEVKEKTNLPVYLATDEDSVSLILKEQPDIRIVVVGTSMRGDTADLAETAASRMNQRRINSAQPCFVVLLEDHPGSTGPKPAMGSGVEGPVRLDALVGYLTLACAAGQPPQA